jgi:DNA invertase Pin-like site-specific DNA recombinase
MKPKKIGYIRVSTLEQNTSRQLDGLELDHIFEEKMSGANMSDRPVLQNLITYILRPGDELFVDSIDRLARSIEDLLQIIKTLRQKSVTIHFRMEKLTITGKEDPFNDLVVQIFGVVAQFFRSLAARQRDEGIAKAKLRGAYKGRKPKFSPQIAQDIQKMYEEFGNVSYIARYYKVSRSTILKYLRKNNNERTNLESN